MWTYRQMLKITRIQENSNQENNEMLFFRHVTTLNVGKDDTSYQYKLIRPLYKYNLILLHEVKYLYSLWSSAILLLEKLVYLYKTSARMLAGAKQSNMDHCKQHNFKWKPCFRRYIFF